MRGILENTIGLRSGIIVIAIHAMTLNAHGGNPVIGRDELIRIIRNEPLQVIRRSAAIPREDLVRANVISSKIEVKSFIVDPKQSYQSGEGLVDSEKPQRQLILGAISREYLLLCFWMGGQGGPGRYLMVIHRYNDKAQVVCYASLGTVGRLRNLGDLTNLIESKRFSPGKW